MFQRCSPQLWGKTPVSTRRVVVPWLNVSARRRSFQSPQPLPLPSLIGNQLQRDRLEVHQQGIRRDVVRPHRLRVEACRVGRGDGEGAAVEHQVAANLANAARAYLAQQPLELVVGQLGIAAAAQVQVAGQDPVVERAIGKGFGLPDIGRPQQVERGIGGHQLHGRGRIQGGACVNSQARFCGVDFRDPEGGCRLRNAGVLQGLRHRGGQVVGARCRSEQAEQG
jgi:hypothetical protein